MKTMTLKILVALLVLVGCVATHLKDYTPASPQEAEIKKMLVRLESCWNNKDAKCVGTLYAPDGEVMVGGRNKRFIPIGKVPKGLLSHIMSKIGNKHFMIAEIKVDGNKAHVIGYVSISKEPSSWLEQHFSLVFREGKWLIKKQYHESYFRGDRDPRDSPRGRGEELN